MKRKFFAFVALLAATLSLSSCLSSDDTTVEYTHDTAITAFSLGTLDRWSKTSAGKDTLLQSNLDASGYKFYIDQTTREIYNADSLPCGARDTAVLATITSKNSGPIIIMHADYPELLDSARYYSSSDSIDFSTPRKIRVYNGDFSAYVTYKITVNVHKQLPDEFNWLPMAQANAKLAALSDLKAVAMGDYVYVFGKTSEGMKVYKTGNTDGVNWEEVTPLSDVVTFSADDYKSAVAMGDYLYILSNGTVYTSTDGRLWASNGSDASLKQLIGASSKYLYAYTQAGISVSTDQGATWTAQTLDNVVDSLPTKNISLSVSPIRSTKNAENLLLMGTHEDADTTATIWTHTVDYDSNSATENMWNYYKMEKNQAYKMPAMDEVLTCSADSGLVALGSNGKWYKSVKGGLTWRVDTLVTLPNAFDNTTARFAFCRDTNKYYWIIRNGYVWKGRFNKDGWRKE